VRGVQDARTADGVFLCDVGVSPGDECRGLRSSWDRVGDVMVTAGNPTEALRLADAAAELIRIDVRPAEDNLGDAHSDARMAIAST
jgi:hypothetical protein